MRSSVGSGKAGTLFCRQGYGRAHLKALRVVVAADDDTAHGALEVDTDEAAKVLLARQVPQMQPHARDFRVLEHLGCKVHCGRGEGWRVHGVTTGGQCERERLCWVLDRGEMVGKGVASVSPDNAGGGEKKTRQEDGEERREQ